MQEEDIQHIADLARLALGAEERAAMRGELASILAFVEKLQEIDVSSVEPTSHGGVGESSLREDTRDFVEDDESVRAKHIRDAFPISKDGMLKVPPILHTNES